MVSLVGFAEPIFVDPAQEKSANPNGAAFCQHRTEYSAAFRTTGKSREGNGPFSGLRPVFSNRFEGGTEETESPLGGIDSRRDRRVGTQNDPSFRRGRRAIPVRIHGAG